MPRLAAETAVLAAMVDEALLVVRAGHTPRAQVQQAVQQLDVVGAEVLGFVLNDPGAISERYAGYDYPREYYSVR